MNGETSLKLVKYFKSKWYSQTRLNEPPLNIEHLPTTTIISGSCFELMIIKVTLERRLLVYKGRCFGAPRFDCIFVFQSKFIWRKTEPADLFVYIERCQQTADLMETLNIGRKTNIKGQWSNLCHGTILRKGVNCPI